MTDRSETYRFYGELAKWWPLVSPPDDYVEEAAYLATQLELASIPVREVLELASGGGHNAVHLKDRFAMTLVDLSDEMLAVSRDLNPECRHVQGDMRTVRLETSFDAVLLYDGVDYMTTLDDLQQTVDTAFAHCRAGGVAVIVPDHTRETYSGTSTGHDGHDGADGRAVRLLEWTWDPDPTDTSLCVEYSFLLREADGVVRSIHETHEVGFFSREEWLGVLRRAGFDAELAIEETTEDRAPRDVFLGHRPSARYRQHR